MHYLRDHRIENAGHILQYILVFYTLFCVQKLKTLSTPVRHTKLNYEHINFLKKVLLHCTSST